MFIEPRSHHQQSTARPGWIEVICGCMFSGKTEELIRRVKRAVIARQQVKIFKPEIDTRYDEVEVVSHNQNAINSLPVASSADIPGMVGVSQVVAIDEAQFFDEDIVETAIKMADEGYRVIISGLDMDYLGRPFGPMPRLLAIAEYVTKLQAICMQCGDVAMYSYRLVDEEEQVVLGEKNEYESRCRKCFLKGMEEKEKRKARAE